MANSTVSGIDELETKLAASIRAFRSRKRYPVLTIEVIDKIPDAELEQVILDFVDCTIEHRDDRRAALHALSPAFQAIYTTWWVEAEVNNGGFNQYFWNSAGQFATEAVAGFELLQASEFAHLMRRAIAINQADQEKLQKFKDRGTLEAFSESYNDNRLNDLDTEFVRIQANLSKLRVAFIRRNTAEFVGRCMAG